MTIYPRARKVVIDGQPVRLTRREMQILECLTKKPGHAVSLEEIQVAFYGQVGAELQTRTVYQHFVGLRRKVGPENFKTIRNFGYKFVGRVRKG